MIEEGKQRELNKKIKQLFEKLPKGTKEKEAFKEELRNQLRKHFTMNWQIGTIESMAFLHLRDFPQKVPEEILEKFEETKRKEKKRKEDEKSGKVNILFGGPSPITDEDVDQFLLQLDIFYSKEDDFVQLKLFRPNTIMDRYPQGTLVELLKMKEELELKLKDKTKEIFDFERVINSMNLVMSLVYLEAFIHECMRIILYFDLPKLTIKVRDDKELTYLQKLFHLKIPTQKKAEQIIDFYLERNSRPIMTLKTMAKTFEIESGLFKKEIEFLN
ncbi:MAG: hypothetical protein ACTSQN_10000 [Candidatus Heimdallarchaeota archaeon]